MKTEQQNDQNFEHQEEHGVAIGHGKEISSEYKIKAEQCEKQYSTHIHTAWVFDKSSCSRADPGSALLFHGLIPLSPGKLAGMISRWMSLVIGPANEHIMPY